MTMTNGRFLIQQNTRIISQEGLEGEASYLAEMIAKGSNFSLEMASEGPDKGNIKLSLDPDVETDEGYRLNVTYDGF